MKVCVRNVVYLCVRERGRNCGVCYENIVCVCVRERESEWCGHVCE